MTDEGDVGDLLRQAEGPGPGRVGGRAGPNHSGQNGEMTHPNVHCKTQEIGHFTDTWKLSEEEETKFPASLTDTITHLPGLFVWFACGFFSFFFKAK